jgi:pimeloyl-ACP methyl ester carboxylesterase
MRIPEVSGPVTHRRRTLVVDGLVTSYLEAGPPAGEHGGEPAGGGPPVVLLHGGEFGASAELGWERVLPLLAARHRVLAPDQLGYGHTAKVHDFTGGRMMRIRHVARFCEVLGITTAYFAGNSMGALNILADVTGDRPLLPVGKIALICGGGEIQRNQHMAALQDYDTSLEGMRRIVTALFADPAYSRDDSYVRRRHESSLLPGAWEAIAAARFRRPAPPGDPAPGQLAADNSNKLVPERPYGRIAVPVLAIEGGSDKLLPPGWAKELAGRVAGGASAVVDGAGHCPQAEQPEETARLLLGFFAAPAPDSDL